MSFKSKYFDLWKAAWAFHQKWHDNNNSDEAWDKIILEADELMKQSKFLKGLILVVIDELDKNYRQNRKEGNK